MILKNTKLHTTKADMRLVTINRKILHRIKIRTKVWSSCMKLDCPYSYSPGVYLGHVSCEQCQYYKV